MENKILNLQQAYSIINKLHSTNKKIVIVGGCFDIIHIGHILFLREAKKLGDLLIVLIEADERIRRNKGKHRPINSLSDRALILSALTYTDYVVKLPDFNSDTEYDEMIYSLKPDIIATTANDLAKHHKIRQAKKLGIEMKEVIERIEDQSTSRIAGL